MKIVLIVIAVLLLISFFRFRSNYKYMEAVLDTLLHYTNLNSNNYLLRLSSAYIRVQHYKDAYDCLQKALNDLNCDADPKEITGNMEFCKKPLPWSKTLKNHDGSFWHEFALKRLGNRRRDFLTEEDILNTNSRLRRGNA